MLYIGYLIILDDHNIKKNQFRKFYCFRQVHLAENLPQEGHTLNGVKTILIQAKIMLYIAWMVILGDHNIKNISFGNSIAFGKSTSQRIYSKQRTHKIGKKRHKYDLKHALHSLDGHFK